MARFILLLLAVGVFGVSGAPAALAEDADADKDAAAPAKPSYPLPGNISKIEGTGLSETVLSHQAWKDARRFDIETLIGKISLSSSNTLVQRLMLDSLLVKAEPPALAKDEEIEPGADFLTLRLEKLLDLGAYEQAYALFSEMQGAPYHPRLLRAGLLSMLFAGEKSLACVEVNTRLEAFEHSEFVQNLAAYCDYSLSGKDGADESSKEQLKKDGNSLLYKIAKDGKYEFTYSPERFEKLRLLDRAVIVAEGRLKHSAIEAENARDLPAPHLQVILHNGKLSDFEKMLVSLRAADEGLVSPTAMRTLYEAFAKPEPEADISKLEAWQKPAALYRLAAAATDDTTKAGFVREAFALRDMFGLSALLPFTDILAHFAPEDASLEECALVFELFLNAGQSVPRAWLKIPEQERFKDSGNKTYDLLVAAAAIYSPQSLEDFRKDIESQGLEGNTSDPDVAQARTILRKLGKIDAQIHTKNNIYEKEFFLTTAQDYVMPSTVMWDHLYNGDIKSRGEITLLSALMLNNAQQGTLYPGLFISMLKRLQEVGLTGISEDLAVLAILEDIENNKRR